jgi:hypothetical protein
VPFLHGGVTAVQYQAEFPPSLDGEATVELLQRFAASDGRLASADGIDAGWAAGRHELDTAFSHEQTVRAGFLCFDLRLTTDRLPAGKLRAYYAIDLAALAASNPSGHPTARQKREARESARERLEAEAADGRYRKHTLVPVVWDRDRSRVWFGSNSGKAQDRFVALFQQTFGVDLTPVNPATLSGGGLDGLATEWVPGVTPAEYSWSPGVDYPLHLGTEFALWLLWRTGDGDEIGDTVVMNARTLTLECPRGMTGRESFSHDSPVRMGEVRRAMQLGKLPRKLGLTVVRHGEQYELTLHADTWAVTGGKVPRPGEDAPTASAERELARLEDVRAMLEAAESVYGVFLDRRRDEQAWQEEVAAVRRWLGVSDAAG